MQKKLVYFTEWKAFAGKMNRSSYRMEDVCSKKRTIEMFWHREGSLNAMMSLYQFHSTFIIITTTTNSLLNEKLPGHLFISIGLDD